MAYHLPKSFLIFSLSGLTTKKFKTAGSLRKVGSIFFKRSEDSSPGRLGGKLKCYLCAIPSPPLPVKDKKTRASHSRHQAGKKSGIPRTTELFSGASFDAKILKKTFYLPLFPSFPWIKVKKWLSSSTRMSETQLRVQCHCSSWYWFLTY